MNLKKKNSSPLLQGRKSRWHDKRDAVNLLGPENEGVCRESGVHQVVTWEARDGDVY